MRQFNSKQLSEWASRFQSDRILNPNNTICPTPLGTDLLGRPALFDSLVTQSAGCNLALDRVAMETAHRPAAFGSIQLAPFEPCQIPPTPAVPAGADVWDELASVRALEREIQARDIARRVRERAAFSGM